MSKISERELNSIFKRYLILFSKHSKDPVMKNITYEFIDKPCLVGSDCKIRDIAETIINYSDYAVMRFTNKILQSRQVAEAIVSHEFGHIIDPWLRDNIPGKEKRADMLAELVTGNRIFYDGNKIQTFSKGTFPRPGGIHQ